MKNFYILIFAVFCFGVGKAQYSVLLNFNGTNSPQGASPSGSLIISGKMLYGMANKGGTNNMGCIFHIDTSGNEYKDLLDFNVTNGKNPYGSLTLLGEKLYGMTRLGGASDSGCIFSVDTNGNAYKDLFDFNGKNGSNPYGSLTFSVGKFYGMTRLGGAKVLGIIFSIDTNGSSFKVLHDFDSINGEFPRGSLIYVSGVLYGMTQGLGYYYGNIFSIDTNGSGFTDLYDFNLVNGLYGAGPNGSLSLSGNVLYGMTEVGGANRYGSIFSIGTNGNNFKDIHDFIDTNGKFPFGSLIYSSGFLYGMTAQGGVNLYGGNIFSIDTSGNGIKELFYFNGSDGVNPLGTLTLSGNELYGMTEEGGADSVGVAFKINTNSIAAINKLTSLNKPVNLYPNPSSGTFFISLSNVTEKCNIEIYNMVGDKVLSEGLPQNQSSKVINLVENPDGVYFYRVLQEDGGLKGEGKIIIAK